MIRVLQVVTYMGRGGLETMLMNYYRHIDRNKVQFDFLVHRDFEADYDQEIRELGGRIYHISRLIPWSRSYRAELKNFFYEHPEYRIVHVHQDCLSSVALQCAEECGVPIRIAHSHNSNQDKNWKYLIKLHYMKQIPYYATDLFACSKSAGRWMFGDNSFQILNNAIDTDWYRYSKSVDMEVREELELGNSIVIGHVGRFDPQKNHGFLIDIFCACTKLDANMKLMLVGDGEGKEKIQQKVRDMNLQDKVIFTGVRSDVSRLMQAMNVFVFPSLYEGLPVTMIEAQAAGLPCIISDHISDECIVTKDLVIRMALEKSPAQWAEFVLQQSHRQHENHSKEIQEANYDISTVTKILEDFYLNEVER